jgi:uncharacterized protein YfaS (alpha-2-macroglobulin family)
MKTKLFELLKKVYKYIEHYSIDISKEIKESFGKLFSYFKFVVTSEIDRFDIQVVAWTSEVVFVFPKLFAKLIYKTRKLVSRIQNSISQKFISTKFGNKINSKWENIPKFAKSFTKVIIVILLVGVWVATPKVRELNNQLKDYEYNNRPALLSSTIQDGENELGLDSVFDVTLSKAVSEKKLERHLKSRSNVDLRVKQIGNKTYRIDIHDGLKIDSNYSINFNDDKLLKNRRIINFETIKSPIVNATNVKAIRESNDRILVSFSPNINLYRISEENPDFLKDLITFEPQVSGEVEILTPSVVRFVPNANYPYDQEVTMRVNNRGIVNEHGLNMTSYYEQRFIINSPKKSEAKMDNHNSDSYRSYERGKLLKVYDSVMNRSSDQVRIALRSNVDMGQFERTTQISIDGYAIPISFVWDRYQTNSFDEGDTYLDFFQYGNVDPEFVVVSISTNQPWDLDSDYNLKMSQEIYGYNEYNNSIRVVDSLKIGNTNIENGLLVDSSYLRINFNNELTTVEEEILNQIKLTNKTENKTIEINPYISYSTLSIWGDFKPNNIYTFTIPGAISDVYGQTLGQDTLFEFKLKEKNAVDLPILLNIFGNKTSFVHNTGKHRILLESRRLNNIDIDVRRISVDDYRELKNSNFTSKQIDSMGRRVEGWTKVFENFNKDESIGKNRVEFQYELNDKEDGIYLISAKSKDGEYRSDKVILLSKYIGVVKSSEKLNEILVWVVDGETGKPAEDIKLNIRYGENKAEQSTTTNNDGIAKFTNVKHDSSIYIYSSNSEIYFESGGSFGLNSSSYDYYYQNDEEDKIYAYFDKPVYRPGNKFSYKIFSRNIQGNNLAPSQNSISIEIRDSKGASIFTNSIQLNDFGTGHDEFILSDNLLSGEYSLYANGKFLNSFRIEDYEIFNFSFNLDTPVGKLYQVNDYVPITVRGNYYFGEPLSNSKVEANLFVRDMSLWEMWEQMDEKYRDFDFVGEDYYGWRGSDYSSRKVGSTKLQTDNRGVASGNVALNVPNDIRNNNFKLLSIEVKVEDPLGETEYTTVYAYVVPNVDLFGTKTSKYTVREGENIAVEAVHLNSKFLPKVGSNIKFVYKRIEETKVRKKNLGGIYSWVNQIEYIEENIDNVLTNSRGVASSIFYPKVKGNYVVEIYRGEEEKPFRISHFSYVDSTSSEYYYDYDNYYHRYQNEISLQTDKDTYRVGQNVSITPVLKSSNYIALETIEKKGVLTYRIVDLRKTPKLENTVSKDGHPNYYYSLFLIQPRGMGGGYIDYRYGIANISVSEDDKRLDIDLITNKEKYKPQEEVNLEIEIKHDGKLLTDKAEVLIAVVDKAVLDVSKIKHNANIEDNMVEKFWSNWMHGVGTSTNLRLYENKIIDEIEWGNKGGDMGIGGDGGGGRRPLELEDVRRDFKEVALWLPIAYAENGKLSTTFNVPDNLTTWEIVTIVITKDTKVGSKTKEIKVSKDINIVSGIPRQLIKGDEVDVVYDIRFDEDFRKTIPRGQVDIQLEVEGLNIECENEKFADYCLRTISIDNLPQQFRVIADEVGDHKLRFGVFMGDKTLDAEEVVLTVLPDTYTDKYISLGMLNEGGTYQYSFPEKTIDESKYLELTFTDKPFEEMRYFEDFFVNYRHYCSEQTSSKILSLLGFSNNEASRKSIVEGIAHLYTIQNVDGGWGIWGNDRTLVYNTAYVLYALNEAEKFGFEVDSDAMSKVRSFLRTTSKNLDNSLYFSNDNLFTLHVLASQGIFEIDKLNNLYDNINLSELSNIDKVYLLSIYYDYKQRIPFTKIFERNFIANRIKRIESELYGSIINRNDYSYWADSQRVNFNYYNNNIKTTAMAFDILLKIDKNDSRLDRVMNYLRTQMETRSNLDTNTNYYMMKALLSANDAYLVNLNGIDPEIRINGKIIDFEFENSEKIIKIPIDKDMKDVEISISNKGKGNAYYEMRLLSDRKLEDVEPAQEGFSIYSETKLEGNTIKKGDVLDQTIYLFVDDSLGQIAVHNPIASGSQVINFNLARMSSSLESEYREQNIQSNRYFPHKAIRDEELLVYSADGLYGSQLQRGIYTISFPVRAAYSGKFKVLGEHGYEMYSPSRTAHNKTEIVEITY